MRLPENLMSPTFEQGDLLTFSFDGAELIFPALTLLNNPQNIDDVSTIKDFRGIGTSEWDTNDSGHHELLLLLQHWSVEHSDSLDEVAACKLWVKLVEIPSLLQAENKLLSTPQFEQLMLDWHAANFIQHDERHAEDPNIPTYSNRYHGKSITKPYLDWFIASLPLNPRLKPIQLLMIPVNNRFVLMAFIKIESLHYAGRTNPYSDELLKQFEVDLFADFLNHIKITYSPELIATINTLKIKTPA